MFVNLRGFGPDPTQPPADPAAVLDGFLRLLGVPGQQVPHSLAARSAAYRQRLAGTQALVVLDNAADAEQVRPRALRIARDIGHRFGELHALTGLGGVDRMLGRHERAAGCYQQVLGLARALGNSNGQFEALQGLGRLLQVTGRSEQALTHHAQALRLATDLNQPTDQARARDGLAHAHRSLRQHDRARRHWQHALETLTSLGTDHTEEPETSVASIRAHLSGLER